MLNSWSLEIWEYGIKKWKLSKSKSVSPKMSARFGLHLRPLFPNRKRTNKTFLLIFLSWPRGPSHPVWGHMLVSFDETCFAGNDSSIVDHALSVVRNHTNHAKGYGSALRVFSKSMNWSLGIWWLLRCAIRETEWAHKVNCTFCIPEGNYRVHTAFPKPDLSGLWVWTPN